MTKQRVHMPKKEYFALHNGNFEITERLILEVARYKLYYMLNNAYNRSKKRKEYKDVKYKLGAYRDGMENLKKHRPDLYRKYLEIIKTYLENRLKGDFSPTIHRTQLHYEWQTIDILTAREHRELDNAKSTIIRNHFVQKKLGEEVESKPLTIEVIKQAAEGIEFPSIIKAIKYVESEYGMSISDIKKIIDTGETIETEKGCFEILKAQSVEEVRKIKMDKFNQLIIKKFPGLPIFLEELESIVRASAEKKEVK